MCVCANVVKTNLLIVYTDGNHSDVKSTTTTNII